MSHTTGFICQNVSCKKVSAEFHISLSAISHISASISISAALDDNLIEASLKNMNGVNKLL